MTPNHGSNQPRRQQATPPQTPPSQQQPPQFAHQPQQQPPRGQTHQNQRQQTAAIQGSPQQQAPVQQQPPAQQQIPAQQQQPTQQQIPAQQAPTQQVAPTRQQRQPRAEQSYLKPARVNQIITENVVTAERDTPVRSVVAMMAKDDVGSVVVVEADRPIGIITDRKVAMALEEAPDVAQRPAEELVTGDLVSADPSMSIFDALQLMSDEGIRRLPIVDDNGALRGIVTLDDMLVLLGGAFAQIAETVEAQSPRL